MQENTQPMDSYHIRTDYKNMDVGAIHQFLSTESYWAKDDPHETVQKSLENSFCIGMFECEKQIGPVDNRLRYVRVPGRCVYSGRAPRQRTFQKDDEIHHGTGVCKRPAQNDAGNPGCPYPI